MPTLVSGIHRAMKIEYDPPQTFPGVVAVSFTLNGEKIGRAYEVPSRDAMENLIAALKLSAQEGNREVSVAMKSAACPQNVTLTTALWALFIRRPAPRERRTP